MPNIHSILLIKNEADIVAHCIRESLRWSDYIYVYDGASSDGTWDIVQQLRSDRVILFKSDGKVFKEGLRAEVYNRYADRAREGDWWCQLNSDEFYVDDPRTFLASVPSRFHVVWGLFIQYYLTETDLQTLNFDHPVGEILKSIRHYRADHAERRFFRHRNRLQWSEDDAWPRHLGITYPKLIRFRHYPYRSPAQIQMRLDVRRDNRARGFEGWEHASDENWRSKIFSASTLHLDAGDGRIILEEDKLPVHMGSRSQRMIQRVMHGLGLWP